MKVMYLYVYYYYQLLTVCRSIQFLLNSNYKASCFFFQFSLHIFNFCSFYSSSRFNVFSINSQFLYVAEVIVSSGCIRWWKLISQSLLFIAKLTSFFVLNILLNFPLHSLFWISLFKLFLLQTHFFPEI